MAFNAEHSCFLCGTQRKWWKASSGPGRGSSSGSPRGTKRRSSSEADGGSERGFAGAGRGMLTMRFPGTWPDGFVTFDICRAKIGHDECGIYMPPIFWQQIGDSWRFRCQIQWDVMKQKCPQAYEVMVDTHGTDRTSWPQPCCGAIFVPWARGPSQVIEIRADCGQWYAFLACRLPQELGDEIKKVPLEWHRACGQLTARDVMDHIPMAVPKTGNETGVPGVARFDLAAWRAKGSPTLTHAGWIALCHLIASKEPVNFERIISVCAELRAKL